MPGDRAGLSTGSAVSAVLSHVCLLLLFTVAASAHAATRLPDTAELRRIVDAYYYAISENRLEEAISIYHADSPQADETRRELLFGASSYLQRTNTLGFDVVSLDGERAVVLATHRHLRIAGIKFLVAIVEARHVLRRQGGTWKIWTIE